MHRRDLILTLSAAALAACSQEQAKTGSEPPQSQAAIADPAAVIRPLYDRYMAPDAQFPPLEDQAPWSQAMRAHLLTMMARSQATGEPILDFDPFVNAQDYQLSNLSVSTDGVVENSHAAVRAAFDNAGARTEVVYDLIWEAGGWKVDNIRGDGWDLRQIAAAPGAP
jgi:hypothetical protein